MKKINILFTFIVLALVMVSCETYDDYNADRKTVVGFSVPSKNINNIPEGPEGRSTTVDLVTSDMSDVDRQFKITTIPAIMEGANPPFVETNPENYTYDATVTILANTRTGTINVTGFANSITDERGEFFTLAVEGGGDVVSGGRTTIKIKKR